MTELLHGIPEGALDRPTPCPAYRLGDLVDHVGGFAVGFTAAARKDIGPITARAPSGDASRLGDDWRTRIPEDLATLAQAWRDPAAWTGMTQAGGRDLPGEIAGLAVLDELVIHGWDVARASGQAYDSEAALLEGVLRFVAAFAGPGREAARELIFGPVVEVPADAPLLDRALALTGRDPAWTPPGPSHP